MSELRPGSQGINQQPRSSLEAEVWPLSSCSPLPCSALAPESFTFPRPGYVGKSFGTFMTVPHWIVFKNLETEARRLNLFSRAQAIPVADA